MGNSFCPLPESVLNDELELFCDEPPGELDELEKLLDVKLKNDLAFFSLFNLASVIDLTKSLSSPFEDTFIECTSTVDRVALICAPGR